MGKSRLVRETIEYARACGAGAGIGRCLDYASAPYAPLLEALGDAGVPSPMQRPDWNRLNPRAQLDAWSDALERAGMRKTLAFAVEDLQCSDADTRNLLRHVAASIDGLRVLILATYRDEGLLAAPLRELLAALYRSAAVWETTLEPLADFEMRALLRNATEGHRQRMLPHLARVESLAEGNPLVAAELVGHLIDSLERGIVPDDVPYSLSDAVTLRLSKLLPPERDVISRAAAIGRTFDAELLGQICTQPPNVVQLALHQAIELQLIEERDGSPGGYAFRHALIHRVIENDLLAAEVRDLHRAISQHAAVQETAAGAAQPRRNRQGRLPGDLTRREREVAAGIADGKTNRDLAAELFVSERTVEDHVSSALSKLGLKNRSELAAYVVRAGLAS